MFYCLSSLGSCNLSVISCAALVSALRSSPSHLRILNLSDNNLQDSDIKQLSKLVRSLKYKLDTPRSVKVDWYCTKHSYYERSTRI